MENNILIGMIGGNTAKKETEKSVWSIPLSKVVSYITMANARGVTQVSREALGCPVVLARDKDTKEVKINKSGRLITQVAKPIRDQVTAMRVAYIAIWDKGVSDYTATPDGKEAYDNERKACLEAGKAIALADTASQNAYNLAIINATAKAEAEAKAKAEAEAIVKASANKVKAVK